MMALSTTLRSYRNKSHGYRQWKEGYVKTTVIKSNVIAKKVLFIVNVKADASMTNISYIVYVHFDQNHGDILEAICTCKAGQGCVCKHVVALLYMMLDYLRLSLKEIPPDMTCIQVVQKWHVPSTVNLTLTKALRFDDITFEKAEIGKKRKRLLLVESIYSVL